MLIDACSDNLRYEKRVAWFQPSWNNITCLATTWGTTDKKQKTPHAEKYFGGMVDFAYIIDAGELASDSQVGTGS